MTLILQLALLFTLVALSAFFSGSETALFSLSRARLIEYKTNPSWVKRQIAHLMHSYHKTLIVLILGNMFVNTGISITNDVIFSGLSWPPVIKTVVSIIAAIILLLVFGEVTPKTIALINAEKFSNKVAIFIWGLSKALTPLIIVADRFFSFLLELIGRKESKPLNHEEYSSYIEIAHSVGAFSNTEVELLRDAIELSQTDVDKVMTGRVDIVSVTPNLTPKQVMHLIKEHKLGFLPVVESDLDNTEKVLVVSEFFALSEQERKNWSNSKCVRPVSFIPENASLTKALSILRASAIPVALVVGEYGGTAGIIELEDIYQEMVGDIDDEYDENLWQVKQVAKNTWHLDGMTQLEDIEEIFKWTIPEDITANTLNGLLAETLDKIPEPGDKVSINGFKFHVLKVDRNRVVEVEAKLAKSVINAQAEI